MRVQLLYFIILLLFLAFLSCKKDVKDVIVTNKPPIVNAGKDGFFLQPIRNIPLNGSALDDGPIVSYTWHKIAGPAGYEIENKGKASTFLDLMEYGIYLLEFKVIDNGGLFGVDTVAFTVDSSGVDPCNGCWDY